MIKLYTLLKYLVVVSSAILTLPISGSAQIYTGSIWLQTQAQIDAFSYSAVTGSVIIEEGIPKNIINLDGLASLTSIGGILEINNNSELNNINGLSNLSSIGGNLSVVGNPLLTQINAFSNIQHLSGLYITGNHALQNINGLSNLRTASSNVRITFNISLQDINGISNLSSVGGSLTIYSNPKITHLNGLANLSHIASGVQINSNVSLENFCGLYTYVSNLLDYLGNVSIWGNKLNPTRSEIESFCKVLLGPMKITSQFQIDGFNYNTIVGDVVIEEYSPGDITNLNGLSDLVYVHNDLIVRNNQSLNEFCGLHPLLSTGTIGGAFQISGNASNPVQSQIIAGGVCRIFTGNITLTNQEQVDVFNYTGVTGDIRINESAPGTITNINSLSSLTWVGKDFFIGNNTALTNLNGLSELTSIGGVLFISFNPALVHINGLLKLKSIEGALILLANHSLQNIDGLSSCLSIRAIQISENRVLTNVNGLRNITTTDQLYLAHNNLLEHIDGLSELQTITGSSHPSIIEYNPLLTNLTGLRNLSFINGKFEINHNASLIDLDGLQKLKMIKGYLYIIGNASLDNIEGLSNLGSFFPNAMEEIIISQNAVLRNIDGLFGIQNVVENVNISFNNNLQHIDGLFRLNQVGSSLSIGGNPNLIHLDGLSNLYGTTYLRVVNNTSLDNYCGLYKLISTGGVTGSITITGNKTNLTSSDYGLLTQCSNIQPDFIITNQAEVEAFIYTHVPANLTVSEESPGAIHNLDGLSKLQSVDGVFYISSNQNIVHLNGLSNLETVGSELYINSNNSLESVSGLTAIKSVEHLRIIGNNALKQIGGYSLLHHVGSFDIRYNDLLLSVIDLPSLKSLHTLYISDNNSLENIDGLEKVKSIEVIMRISNNDALQNLNGLKELVSVGAPSNHSTSISIAGNNNLNNLDGLSSLAIVDKDLVINNNILLNDFCGLYHLLSTEGLKGNYLVQSNASNPTINEIVDGGSCSGGSTNNCPETQNSNVSGKSGAELAIQLQGSDADNDPLVFTISEQPLNGTVTTSSTGSAIYKSIDGYTGTDHFKFKVWDGQCETEGAVNLLLVKCPEGTGYWINKPDTWPASATPMFLGNVSYSKAELITILETSPGSKNKVDASILLAHKIIPLKLNLINGAEATTGILDSIAAANQIISNNRIPMNVRTNTPLGKRMVKLAEFFDAFNTGTLTEGCYEQPMHSVITYNYEELPVKNAYKLHQNFPNPFNNHTTIIYELPETQNVQIAVFNLQGQQLMTVVDGMKPGGRSTAIINAGKLSAGIYFCRMTAGGFNSVIKLVVNK